MTRQNQHKVLILGGGCAGLLAAARISRSNADVTLIDTRPSFFQRIRFHEMLAGGSPKTLDYAPLLDRRGVRFVQARAEGVETGRQRVLARSGDGSRIELGYDTLIFALGSTTAPGVPGAAEHAIRLDDPAAIREAAARIRTLAASGGRVLVAGGGLTGIETATELAERYPALRVTLATRGRVGEDYSEAGSAHLRRRLTGSGVSILDGAGIVGLEPDQALLGDGGAVPFDLCVWAGGFEAPALAREAGLAVDRSGRILVDPALRSTSHPDVFGAGDAAVATFADGQGGRDIRMGCVSALPLGAHAGENVRRLIRGEELRPFEFGFAIRCISLGRKDGLVQFVETDDTPRPKVWTRRAAILTKELICRMTYAVVQNELRLGIPLYRWPGPDRKAMVQSSSRRAEARSQG